MKRVVVLAAFLAACGSSATTAHPTPHVDAPLPPLPWETEWATRPPVESALVALRGGRVMTAAGDDLPHGTVVMEHGSIVAVGAADAVHVPEGATIIDTTGRVVTPGLIDTHSHMGVYAQPELHATDDGNEATAPVTAEVRAVDSFWPQDPALTRALAAGITTIEVLPGSANLIGGRGVVLKLHLGRGAQEMRFPGAPDTLKMACGENPKRVYGEQHQAPSTRMGNIAGYRAAYQGAVEYVAAWHEWQGKWRLWRIKQIKYQHAHETHADGGVHVVVTEDGGEAEDPGPEPPPPERDFGKETLALVIEGRILVQNHCYRADEMLEMMQLAHDYGFHIRSFHHAVEAYKIRDVLAAENVGVSTWADWWGFKLEAFDAIPENLALLDEAGVHAIVHSDDPMYVQRFGQEAAKAMYAGRNGGVDVSEDHALRWITANPAWALGVAERTGTLETGKMADVVVWSATPFSVYSHVDLVYVDGQLAFDRAHPDPLDRTDFEVGL